MTYEELKLRVQKLQEEGKLSKKLTREERIDWAYGNAVLSNPNITREMSEVAFGGLRNKEDKV